MTVRSRPASATATTVSRCSSCPAPTNSRNYGHDQAAGHGHFVRAGRRQHWRQRLGGRRIDSQAGEHRDRHFAGGCFWCTKADFEKLPGVIGTQSGYTTGKKSNPTYEQVSAGGTGHTEAVRVTDDPAKVSYAQLVDDFWQTIDPTVKDQQFCDTGSQYRSGIYWQKEAERKVAESSRDALLTSGKFKVIHTEIIAATIFYLAENYHQDYYKKDPIRYTYYRHGCGRDARLEELWGKK